MRYYFHLVSAQKIILDTTGVEIDESETVQSQLRRLIHEVREADQIIEDLQGWRIDVEDPSGNVVLSVSLDTRLLLPSQLTYAALTRRTALREI